jgi:GTP cyclohydrolase IA
MKSITDVKIHIGKRKAAKSEKLITKGFSLVLDGLKEAHGLDWKNDPNFDETPERIARSLLYERCKGINSYEYCKKLLEKTFPAEYRGMIIANPIMVNSLCPHHFENVFYLVVAGYIPVKKIVGLSKIGRVIDMYGRQPILQETFTRDLADIFYAGLEPEGCGIITIGQHNCMVARGIQQPDPWVTMSEMRGSFLENPSVKDEFIKFAESKLKKVNL